MLFVDMTGTSGRQHLVARAVSAYPVVMVADTVTADLEDFVHPWFARSTHLRHKSRGVAQQCDALPSQLVSGRLQTVV